MSYQIIIRTGEDEPLYTRRVAAQLARVSLDFLRRCEQERIVRPRPLPGGNLGYTARDIQSLARARRLRSSLGLNMPAVEVVFHLRRQVLDLQTRLEQVEREMEQREQAWLREVQELRRQLAQEARYRRRG